MKNLISAMEEEKAYIADRLNNIETVFVDRLAPYGYNNLAEYFSDKKKYLFNQWKPEVYGVNVATLTTELENAVQNERYGIYISVADGLYAFHGSDEIDYELCDELGVCVAEVYHQGGTLIGSQADLGIEIIAPTELGLEHNQIINKFYEVISKYEDNVIIDGNDILVNGEKVLGSMTRRIGHAFVWAAQVSFEDHMEIIQQICHKKSFKKPGVLHNVTKEILLQEVLRWLQKS